MAAPLTKWTRDNGTILEENTGVLVDELANLFVDEDGNNLGDSVSSDGLLPVTTWTGDEY